MDACPLRVGECTVHTVHCFICIFILSTVRLFVAGLVAYAECYAQPGQFSPLQFSLSCPVLGVCTGIYLHLLGFPFPFKSLLVGVSTRKRAYAAELTQWSRLFAFIFTVRPHAQGECR